MKWLKVMVGLATTGALLMLCSCLPRASAPVVQPGGEVFAAAEQQYNEKLYNSALTLYQDYLNRFPGGEERSSALLRVGDIFFLRGEYADARELYDQVIKQFPKNRSAEEARIGMLLSWYNEKSYFRVLDYAYVIVDEQVSEECVARKYAVVSDAYMGLEEPVDAVRVLLSAMKKVGEAGQKKILIKLDQISGRIKTEDLQRLLADISDPAFRGYLTNQIGSRYMQKGDYERAAELLSGFIDAHPDSTYAVTAAEMTRQMETMTVANSHAIGCLLPLSGDYRLFGERALKGIQFAFQEFVERRSREGGKTAIRLVIEDTGSDPEQAVRAVRSLADQQVAAIIGPLVTLKDAIQEADNRRIPIITLVQEQNIPAMGDYVFRNFLTPQMQVDSLTGYVCRVLGLRRFAVLYPDEEYGRVFAYKFRDEILKCGGEMVGFEAYNPSETDFAAPIRKLIGSSRSKGSFEALFIPDGPSTAGLIIPQLVYHDVVDRLLLGTNLWYSQELIKTAGIYVQGAVMPADFWEDEYSGDGPPPFSIRYESVYNEKPGFVSAVTYDTALILMGIIDDPDVLHRHMIVDRLAGMAGYPGVTGMTAFGPDGEVEKTLPLLRIQGRNFEKVGGPGAVFTPAAETGTGD